MSATSGPKEGFGSSVGISEKDVPFGGDLDGCRSCEQKKSKDYGGDLSTEVRLADLRLHKSFAT
jgi:hypothetical protein